MDVMRVRSAAGTALSSCQPKSTKGMFVGASS